MRASGSGGWKEPLEQEFSLSRATTLFFVIMNEFPYSSSSVTSSASVPQYPNHKSQTFFDSSSQ